MTTASTATGRDILLKHRRTVRRRLAFIVMLAAFGLLAFLADLVTGPSGLGLEDTLATLFDTRPTSRAAQVIVWQVRLPTSGMALLVGAALALAGAEMQTILGNPLAEPFTLGVSSCAALGAAVAIVLGLSLPLVPPGWTISASAFVFALGSLFAVHGLARWRGAGPQTLILFGIAIGFTAGALLSLVQFMASTDALQQLVFWSMGSLARANAHSLLVVAAVLAVCAPFSFAASWRFTVLRLGEERARSLGIDVERLRMTAILRIGLLSATSVAFVGVIGFVRLVGPHIARMLVGEDHRFLMPASMAVGAPVMLAASIASKTIVPGVLIPIGIVTALVGLPVFFALVLRRRGGGRSMTIDKDRMDDDKIFTVRDLQAGYGGSAVIERLSLPPMVPGRLVALVGPNAAGKSTLLRAMAQLIRVKGDIRLGGRDLAHLSPGERAAAIGFMPQSLPDDVSLSVLESVIAAIRVTTRGTAASDGQRTDERALEVLEGLGVSDLATRPLTRLSGGQKQVVSLAQAIVCAPPVLLLDEPTSALDPARQFLIMRIVKDYAVAGRIVVAVMHDLALAAHWADEVVVLSEGRLHGAGPPADILTPGMLAEVYGIRARVERCSEGRLQFLVDGVVPRPPASVTPSPQTQPDAREEFR